MEITNIKNSGLSNALRLLAVDILVKHGTCPVFFDVVSVELTNRKEYGVLWLASMEMLKVYYAAVEKYFSPENPDNQSLLFLQNRMEGESLHEPFSLCEESFEKGISGYDKAYDAKINLDKLGQVISEKDEALHRENWKKNVLKKLGLAFFSFSKIEITIGESRYAVALWMGFNRQIDIDSPGAKLIVDKFLWAYALNSIALEIQQDLALQATRAAIADIINRNQAHHLGSHVSNRSTLDKVLERLSKDYTDLVDKDTYSSILRLLNRFNHYRDERSEYLTYLAQFSSPSSAYLFKDVLQPFMENTLVMDNIAANENLNYVKTAEEHLLHNRLQLRIRTKDGKSREKFYASYLKKDETVLYTSEDLPYLREDYDRAVLSREDVEVSLPGTLGKHALYSILENFIRNSAKHGGDEKYKGLDIILELSDLADPDCLTVRITDNCSKVTDAKVAAFNESINSSILERRDLGLIDMKVNACLLEGKELTDENCRQSLRALKTKEGILEYEFRIAKPKKAVFIGCIERIGKEKASGCFYFDNIDAFIGSKISKSFKFAVIDASLLEGLDRKKKMKLFSQLPARILYFNERIKRDLSKNENKEILTILYSHWIENLAESERPKFQVHLTFEQEDSEEPTLSFKNNPVFQKQDVLAIHSKKDLADGVSFEDDKEHIFFDRHGAIIRGFEKSFVKNKNHCWILIDKNNPDFDYISRFNLNTNAGLLPHELAEAGLLKILVIDERIAELSSRIEKDTELSKLTSSQYGFTKLNIEKDNLTLFDIAWAAKIYIATHLNEKPLKNEIDIEVGDKHVLKVGIQKDRKITYDVNLTSLYGEYHRGVGVRGTGQWTFSDGSPKLTDIDLKPHILVIHRTKLQELIMKYSITVEEITEQIPCVIVTTGSGTTHGMEGEFKIIPFSTLNELLLGKRIQKLRLSKVLGELNKNNI